MARNRIIIGRRAFLLGLGTLAGMVVVTTVDKFRLLKNNQVQAKERDFAVVGKTSLRNRAAAKGLIYGAAGSYRTLSSNAEFANRFAEECGILVPENDLKWNVLRPGPDRFNFKPGDWLAEFARSHDMLFRGHTLVWHKSLPKWFNETVNRKNAEQVLVNHIKKVAGHYAGKMHSWDVVNEAIEVSGGRSDGLRKSPWLQLLGPDYIEIAFRAAAEADSKALLVYNDHRLEYSQHNNEAKRTKVLKLLERLKSSRVPLHALGIQSHLGANMNNFDPKKLRDFLKDVANLGLKIIVTEMDVIEKQPLNVAARDRLIAGVYEEYLSVVLDEPAVIAVLTWGLSDRYTWVAKKFPRKDDQSARPLPLDTELKPKLAWNAIARAFDKAPMR